MPGDGNKGFRELLGGAGKGEMNLAALAARGRDMQRTLDEVLAGLTHNAHNISWCAAGRRAISARAGASVMRCASRRPAMAHLGC